MTKKQKTALVRIIITAVIFAPLLVAEHTGGLDDVPTVLKFVIFLLPYAIIGYDVVRKALINISKGHVFDENFLMMIATFGALAVQEFPEAVAVMLFYQVGELFQSYAVGKSRQSISAMMDMAPEYANLEGEDGIEQVDPDDVEVGSIIVVKPGEKVPLDGIVIEGESMLDTSALTGESVPRRISADDEIYSGCINGNGTLRVRTIKEYDDSTVAKILELVENAGDKKAQVENFITRFAKYYTPVVTLSAVALTVIGPVAVIAGRASALSVSFADVVSSLAQTGELGGIISTWLLRACTFLVVSCPCALVISVPLGFFGGIGAASRHGILVKGSNYLELVSKVDTVVFDKTGTLTKGEFKVSKVIARNMRADELLEIAAHGESYSTHPIALSIIDAYKERNNTIDSSRVEDAHEDAGHGVDVSIDNKKVILGNSRHLEKHGIAFEPCEENGTVVYAAIDGTYAGAIVISDTVKEGAAEAVRNMKRAKVKCIMLTGDREAATEYAAKELGIDDHYSDLLPGDKVGKVEELLKSEGEGRYLAFVGDGINDAPVLARADVGIAMGSMGSDAAIEAADIVLMDDDIRKIATVIRISGRTMAIVRQNIVFALSVKLLVLVLGAFGIANMWAAVFADVGVAVLAILNSMRALKS